MGTGPSGAALPCLPSGTLGQCPGYQPASPGTAAMSLLPSRKARNEAAAAGPTPKPAKQALHRASASGQEAPGGGHDLHTMGKAGPAHSSCSRPRAPRWGGAAPVQPAWTQQALFDMASKQPTRAVQPSPSTHPVPHPVVGQTQAQLYVSHRAGTDLVCAASPPSQWLRRSWYPWPPETGVTQGCSVYLLSRLSPAGLAAASRKSQEGM